MKAIIVAVFLSVASNAIAANELCEAMAKSSVAMYKAAQVGVPKSKVYTIVSTSFEDNGIGEAVNSVHGIVDAIYELPPGLRDGTIYNTVIDNCNE